MMSYDKFQNWLYEEKTKNKNFYVLVGPPAVGKTNWIKNFIEESGESYTVISRDQIIEDQIFPKYKLANNELYGIIPPSGAIIGQTVNGFEKYGKVIQDRKGRKAFKNILEANQEVEEQIKKQISAALSTKPDNIIVDAVNGTSLERANALNLIANKPEYKKIAIYFEFEPYRKEIEARAQNRSQQVKKELGGAFGREVPSKVYDVMFSRITKPHNSEGFDEITSYDSFKGVKTATMQPTAESLTLGFRKYLNEEINEENFGVVKTGSGLSVNYVLIDTSALLKLYKSLDPQNPDIRKKDLIGNNVVVSAIKIAENTQELKDEYGTCMNASQVKVSAVNKNLARKGYGKRLYKIIMSEHPEGLYPDRDFVSPKAANAWVDMSSTGVKSKEIKDGDDTRDVFDDKNNPKTPTPEDDCVIHPRYDGDPLNRAYTYGSENIDVYLMKAHEALATCEEMIPGGWTIESLEDLIVDAGMSLYDIAIGFEGDLQESRLSKIFRREAKQKARRSEEKYGYKHRKWAEKRQKKWNTENPELEELYLKEIENATAAAKAAKEYLEKRREIRRKKLEEKEKAKLGHPQEKVKYNKSRKPEKPPKSNKRGIAAIKDKAKQAYVFAGASAPGGAAGSLEETQNEDYLNEIEIIPQEEEKGDGKYRS